MPRGGRRGRRPGRGEGSRGSGASFCQTRASADEGATDDDPPRVSQDAQVPAWIVLVHDQVGRAALNDAGQTLQVDQAKAWSVQVDDVDRRQAMGDMQSWMEERAAYRVADTADQFLAAQYVGVASANVLGTSGSPITPGLYNPSSAPADFYVKVVLPLKVLLGQQNVPDDGNRYLIVPPWARGLIEQTQAFVAFPGGGGGAGAVMQNGFFGKIGGFNLMESNNSVQVVPGGPGTGVWAIQAGHRDAITYAEQIVQTEALRAQATFADLVRGLHVYGAKVIRPEAMAVAYTLRPTGI